MGGRTGSFFIGFVGVALAGALAVQPVAAQEPSNAELKKEIQALGSSVKAIQQDLDRKSTRLNSSH